MNDFLVDVLAFGAHPDDVELFCGGVMLRLADLGHTTAVVDLTRGERASHGTPDERAREAAAAASVLGLAFRENLGLPDTLVDGASPAQLERVVEVLRRRRPEIVLAPWLEERHPDHAAAGALVSRAVILAAVGKFPTDPPSVRFAPRQLLYYEMRHRMTPTFVMDTSAAAARKAQAIACHTSQVTRRPGEPATLISSGRALEAIEARDRYRGSQIGAVHGEALRTAGVTGVIDPVAFFRANPFAFGEAHAFEPLR